MGLTTDPTSPCLKEIGENGQQKCYLVLSEEERAKGFIRPVRRLYRHVGERPRGATRPLTEDEQRQYAAFGYVLFEEYGPERDPVTGRFWTQAQLSSGCGCVTSMGAALAETYARDPKFYGGTFCCNCGRHFPVGGFVWEPDGSVVGS